MNTQKVLQEVKKEIAPEKSIILEIKKGTKKITEELSSRIRGKKLIARVFVGGSFAKDTVIKKKNYDVDIFVRFDKKYEDWEISGYLEKILSGMNAEKVHGSRDYFMIKRGNVIFEIIPVRNISKPREAVNVADLSYFHVSYVRKKIAKHKKLADEIRLAKTFCYAQKCYGAESYIKGFSGYALELLIIHYGSFLKFIKEVSKIKEKVIIDPEQHYKNKKIISLDMNESKLKSPIVFVDPTFKERNALAALSDETFDKFKNSCSKFLKNPSEEFFIMKEFSLSDFEKYSEKNKLESLKINISTDRQEGDIAGTKLLKFSNMLEEKMEKYFEIKKKEFVYEDKKSADVYLAFKPRKEIILRGPSVKLPEFSKAFKAEHKNIFEKKGILFAREKVNFTGKEFVENFKEKYSKLIADMGVTELNV